MQRHNLPVLVVVVLGLLALAAPANAAVPVEGYRSPDNRVGCVMYQAFNKDGNAFKCGRRGSSRGLLLTGAGAARRATWRWPATQLGSLFFRARPGQTLYLVGGTAKVNGDERTLRCTFTRSSVRCLNGSGDGISVSRAGTQRIRV
jgi:hypothetical protein